MIDWTNVIVRGGIVALIAFAGFLMLRQARRQGKIEAELRSQLAGEKTKAEIESKSNASSEAADARRDPSVYTVDDVVRGDTLPDWLKR